MQRAAIVLLATAGAAEAFQLSGVVPVPRTRQAISLRMQQEPAPTALSCSR
jgi:hypothetical protein